MSRFVSVDPGRMAFEVPQSLNRYIYGVNDPINMTDPDGEFSIFGGIGGLFKAIGTILGIVRSVPPIFIPNHFQATLKKADPVYAATRLAVIAAWAEAIADQDEEAGVPHHLRVIEDCYTATTTGLARRRKYRVEDVNGNPVTRTGYVKETNRIIQGETYGDFTWKSSDKSQLYLGEFFDYINSTKVTLQDQYFEADGRKLLIKDIHGNMPPTGINHIYSDRNVVDINGDQRKDSSGNLIKCK